ncbi:MAG: metallophosphoesterase [Promethearchaeota archaeon]
MSSNNMNKNKILDRYRIFQRIINAGINISPNALQKLTDAKITDHDIEDLIRKISFKSDFQSHITLDILKPFNLMKYSSNSKFKLNNHEKNGSRKKNLNSESKSLDELTNSVNYGEKGEKEEKKSNESKNDTKPFFDEIKEAEKIADEVINSSEKIFKNRSKSRSLQESDITSEEKKDLRLKKLQNIVLKSQNMGGFSNFIPIAKDNYAQLKILSDPTKKIFTSGSIEDFFELMNDRFKSLKLILQKNSEVKESMSIRNLNSLQNSAEIGFIGMVKEKRTVGKNKHVKIILEDLTGEISVLVRNDYKNEDLYKKMKYLLNDLVVYVSGYLKVDPRKKSRIVFANNIIWPDIPLKSRDPLPDSPVSIALISDTHIGSTNFMSKLFNRFIRYLKCDLGSEKERKEAGKIKYLVIAGDLVDGIGIYPNQEKELEISDIFKQFQKSAEYLEEIPDYIKIIYSPGNHEPVRNALPYPAVPKKYSQCLLDIGVVMTGNPSLLSLHGLKTLCFHGDSIIDLNMTIPDLDNKAPERTMREYLRCRHLAPIYGNKSEIAPTAKDWLVIRNPPHILHTGHVHINAMEYYRNVLMVNSGCFQSQTSFMKSQGIIPTPGRPVIISSEYGKLNAFSINLTL